MTFEAVIRFATKVDEAGAGSVLDRSPLVIPLPVRLSRELRELLALVPARSLRDLLASRHLLGAARRVARDGALALAIARWLEVAWDDYDGTEEDDDDDDELELSSGRPAARAGSLPTSVAATPSVSLPPDDLAGAVEWAKRAGVEFALDLSLRRLGLAFGEAILARQVFEPVRPPSDAPGWVPQLRQLRPLARRALAGIAQEQVELRAARDRREAASAPPRAAELRAALARFESLAATSRFVAPGLSLWDVTFAVAPPRFRLQAHQGNRCWLVAEVEATDPEALGLGPDSAARAAGLQALCSSLRDPRSAAMRDAEEYFRVPSWQRVLSKLTTSLGAAPPATRQGRLAFRVRAEGGRVVVLPLLQEPASRGAFTPGRAVDRRVAARHAADAMDQRVLAALRAPDDLADASGPEHDFAALVALADHPRVFCGRRNRPVVIRRARIGLALVPHEDAHAVRVVLAGKQIEGAALRSAMDARGRVVLIDPEADTIALAELDPRASVVVTVLAEERALFPAESIDALLAPLQALQDTLDLDLPDSLIGRSVPPDERTVVRLQVLPGGALRLTAHVRPLAGGALQLPGAGPERVFGAAAGARVSTRRDLEREREIADEVLAHLPLGDAERDGHTLRIPDPDHAADVVIALRELGDRVVVEWPEGEALRVVGEATRRDLRVRIEKKRDWFGVDGEIEIDGTRVALAAMLDAARAGHRFVRIGEGRFVALASELRARLREADDVLAKGKGGLEASWAAAPSLSGLVEDESQVRAAVEWTRMIERMRRAEELEVGVPATVQASLRGYQAEGVAWMARLASWSAGGCLADDMGLGKTVQALALLAHRASHGPALVLAPTSVAPNWVAEARRFVPSLDLRLSHGAGRSRHLDDLGAQAVVVTSYELLVRDLEALSGISWATLILDEAQAIKNAQSLRAGAARALEAEVRFALTGTPVENHLGELWSIFRVVTPGLFGSWEQFRGRFAAPIERDRDPRRRAALVAVLRPFLLRRTKLAVAPELPPRTEMVRTVTLSPAERALYEAERLRAIEIAGDPDPRARLAVLQAITRLRRLASHPRLVDEGSTVQSSKLAAFVELVDELREAGHRALVFSQFTSHLALAREALDGLGIAYQYLDGSTSSAARQAAISAFQGGRGDLFLISLKAGGFGLNLTGADYVIHLDPWWNPAAEDQATDRAHRIGQDKPVTVVRLVARGTIEDAVLSLHGEKRELAASLLGGAEVAGKLSAQELSALVRAGEGAEADDLDIDPAASAPAPPAQPPAPAGVAARGRRRGPPKAAPRGGA